MYILIIFFTVPSFVIPLVSTLAVAFLSGACFCGVLFLLFCLACRDYQSRNSRSTSTSLRPTLDQQVRVVSNRPIGDGATTHATGDRTNNSHQGVTFDLQPTVVSPSHPSNQTSAQPNSTLQEAPPPSYEAANDYSSPPSPGQPPAYGTASTQPLPPSAPESDQPPQYPACPPDLRTDHEQCPPGLET